MNEVPLHPTAEAALERLGDLTLPVLAEAVARADGWVTADLAAAVEVVGEDGRKPLGRDELLGAARREAEIFGDNWVRCEYLLLGALRLLGDEARLDTVRARFQTLMGDRAFAEYKQLVLKPRAQGARPPVLVLTAGLPGTGKSTLAEGLAVALPAPVFSMDWQLGALVPFGVLRPDNTGPLSELTLIAAAARQLQLGLDVIVDATGHLSAFRRRLRVLAEELDSRFVGVEFLCSDTEMHRRRVQGRSRGIPGWAATVSWEHVMRMRDRWQDWDEPHLIVDSAKEEPDIGLRRLLGVIKNSEPLEGDRAS